MSIWAFRFLLWYLCILLVQPQNRWSHIPSIQMVRELMSDRMYPLTLEGLEQGIRALQRSR